MSNLDPAYEAALQARHRKMLAAMFPELAAHDDALDQQEREEDALYAAARVRCKLCQSDQMQVIGREQTIIGAGIRYACQSCGQESIRVD